MKKSRKLSALAIPVLILCSLQAAATSVLPISLERMTAAADLIFHGRAVGNEVRLDPVSGRVATFTRFEVLELIKGKAGETHTIKQIGGQLPGSNVRQVIHGVPQFSTGEEYVVFLPKASGLGFSSPIGLSQGKFDIHKLDGRSVIKRRGAIDAVVNTTSQQTPADVPSAIEIHQPGADADNVELADFVQSVRAMTRD